MSEFGLVTGHIDHSYRYVRSVYYVLPTHLEPVSRRSCVFIHYVQPEYAHARGHYTPQQENWDTYLFIVDFPEWGSNTGKKDSWKTCHETGKFKWQILINMFNCCHGWYVNMGTTMLTILSMWQYKTCTNYGRTYNCNDIWKNY